MKRIPVERKPLAIITDEQFLRQKSRHTTVEECARLNLWDKLRAALLSTENGLGLAAVQIGVPVRASLMMFPSKKGGLAEVRLVNPMIRAVSGQFITYKNEGCLSFPGIFKNTSRHILLWLSDDINGNTKYEGTGAVAVQHELDHMDGILFFDREVKVIKRKGPKIGRNEECPCGSGKKYKKCCGMR